VDPDPYYVFGPPGSGSKFVIICTDPEPDPPKILQKSKNIISILLLLLLYDFDVNVLQKVKNLGKKLVFVDILKATDEKSRIRIRNSVVRIRGSGSVLKCHGSTTLELAH
jgi:hypothetical protein